MPSFRSTLGVAVLLLTMACDHPPTDPAVPNHGGGEPPVGDPAAAAPPGEEAGAEPAATVSKPSELILGEWALELTPTQQRQYELLEIAFRDPPPTEQELAELELSPEEQLMIGMVLMGREQHPEEHGDPDVRQGLEELASATLTITADSLEFAYGEERDPAQYTVLSEETSSLVIETTSPTEGAPVVEKVNVQLDGTDRLVLWAEGDDAGTRQTFTRRGTGLQGGAALEQPSGEPAANAAKPTPASP